jgi:hypothetical protein
MTTLEFYTELYDNRLSKKIYTQPFYDELLQITHFLPDFCHYSERIYCLINNITTRPVCKQCGNVVKFPHHLIKDDRRYRRFCSTKCSNNNENVQKEKSKTCMKNYGVDNPSKCGVIHQKKVNTIMKNYGGFAFASPILKHRIIETNIKKYGGPIVMMLPEFKEKSKNTLIKNYGSEGMRNPIITKKMDTTKRSIYGEDVYKDVARKAIQTKYKKYGKNGMAQFTKKAMLTRYKRYGTFSIKGCSYSKIAISYIENYISKNNIDPRKCLYGKNEMMISNENKNYLYDLVVFNTIDGLVSRDIHDISLILEYDGATWHPSIDQSISYRNQPMPITKTPYREKYLSDLRKMKFAKKIVERCGGSFVIIRENGNIKNLP